MTHHGRLFAMAAMIASVSRAEVEVAVNRNDNEHASREFKFEKVPSPRRNDAAAKAKITIVDGLQDPYSGAIERLNDGAVPGSADQPAANFFFRQGMDGGRVLVDLGNAVEVKQVNSYSWHPRERGPQVYSLFASDGKDASFNRTPKRGVEPESCGWRLVAKVDTREKDSRGGGQYGVSISDSKGSIGSFRYLLFDVSRTESADAMGNTFFSEIDVIDRNASDAPEAPLADSMQTVDFGNGKYRCTFDTTAAPDLMAWARDEMAPVVQEWYPKIVAMLPSEGFEAPRSFEIIIEPMDGVANTAGTRVRVSAEWIRKTIKGEAKGSVVHELVHVAQQYGNSRRGAKGERVPGWLVEAIPDYIRWYDYEPQSHGADIPKRNADRVKFDQSYRVSANFLNWVANTYDKEIIRKLNASVREGNYGSEVWKSATGHTVEELGVEWKKGLTK